MDSLIKTVEIILGALFSLGMYQAVSTSELWLRFFS